MLSLADDARFFEEQLDSEGDNSESEVAEDDSNDKEKVNLEDNAEVDSEDDEVEERECHISRGTRNK